MSTMSKVNAMETLFLVIIMVAMDTVLTNTVCNTMEHGQFKCECMEITNAHVIVNCSYNNFNRIPPEGFPRETSRL
jgi:hypothetical protein